VKHKTHARVAKIVAAVTALGLASACSDTGSGGAVDGEITIGAAWPLSGTFAYNGEAVLAGAEAAIDDINEAGGIESLDGAQLNLSSVDAGATPQSASSAVNRLLRDDNVVAIAGSWLSSLTLAASEVTERQGVAMVSESFADEVTGRDGFSHVFSYSPPSSQLAPLIYDSSLPGLEEAGIDVSKIAVVGDNSAAATPLQDGLLAEAEERGLDVAMTEQWASPLQDASGVAQKIANADVDAVYMIAFGFSDVSSLVSQLRSRGVDVPVIQNGGQAIVPQWREAGDDIVGLSSFVYTNPLNKSSELAADLAEATGSPYVWQDQLGGYFAIQVIAAALEEAGSADREAVNDALHDMELTSGPVVDLMPVGSFSFDESGRIDPTSGVLAQWQKVDGELIPCTVFPAEVAECDPVWGK
jgi:branched-chain amino acid transport system substrate-binding protein